MKKLSLLLALLMPLGCLAACTPSSGPAEQTTPEEPVEEETTLPDQTTEPEVTTEPEETVPDTGYPVDLFEIGGTAFSSFALYVQPGAAKGITDAVDMLIEYAEKATGHKLSVTEDASTEHLIVIGQTDLDTEAVTSARAQIKNDGYAIVEDGGKLYVTGSCTAGTAYGVYTFMENYLGVRFYATDFTVVRDTPIVRVPANYCEIYNPAFIARDSFWYDLEHNPVLSVQLKDNSCYNADIEGGISYAGSFLHTLSALTGTAHEIGK